MSPMRLGYFAAQTAGKQKFDRSVYAGITYATTNDGPSIQTAINSAAAVASSGARQLVVVPPGTYSVSASIDAADWVDVIGDTENPDDVIITTTANDDVMDNGGHNTLWAYMTLIHRGLSSNTGYAVHTDSSGANTEMTMLDMKLWSQTKCGMGVGIRGTQFLYLFGCEIVSDNSTGDFSAAYFVHNLSGQSSGTRMVAVDCVAYSTSTAVGFQYTELNSGQTDRMYWFRGRIYSVGGNDILINADFNNTDFYIDSSAYDTITDNTTGRVYDTVGETITMPTWQPFSSWRPTPEAYVPPTVDYNPLSEPWQLAWWAGDPMAHDDPRVDQVVDGGQVTAWPGHGSNSILPLVGTGTYRASAAVLNNKPAFEFNGSTDQLISPAVSYAVPYTIVIIFYIPTVANQRVLSGAGSTQWYINTNGSLKWTTRFTTAQASAANATVGAHLGVVQAVTGNDTVSIDGTDVISGVDAGAQTLARISLGRVVSAAYSACHVAFVGIYAGDPTGEAWWPDFVTFAQSHGVTMA